MIFIDTSAFLALENRKDEYHKPALMFRDSLLKSKEPLLTSDYVLDESYTIIRLRAGHTIAVEFGEMIQATGLVEIKYLPKEILREAWHIFKSFAAILLSGLCLPRETRSMFHWGGLLKALSDVEGKRT